MLWFQVVCSPGRRGERETGCECVFRLYTVEEWTITIYASLSPWSPPYRSPPPHTHRHPPTKTNTRRTETAEPGVFLGSPIFPFCSVSDGGASVQRIKQRVAPEGPGEARGQEIQVDKSEGIARAWLLPRNSALRTNRAFKTLQC